MKNNFVWLYVMMSVNNSTRALLLPTIQRAADGALRLEVLLLIPQVLGLHSPHMFGNSDAPIC
jgi:hypothetical protein